jgi:DNA-directed RNA polymerase
MPIYLDATCSGIQHLSSLIKDLESGSKVNLLTQSKKDKVGDIYSELLEPINLAIK